MNSKMVLQSPSFIKGREVQDLDFLFVMPEVRHSEKWRPTSQEEIPHSNQFRIVKKLSTTAQ